MIHIYEELGLSRRSDLSHECLLTYDEANRLIAHIRKTQQYIIWGGDVLTNLQHYTGDQWYYEKSDNTIQKIAVQESCDVAQSYIDNYQKNNGTNFFFIFVITETAVL